MADLDLTPEQISKINTDLGIPAPNTVRLAGVIGASGPARISILHVREGGRAHAFARRCGWLRAIAYGPLLPSPPPPDTTPGHDGPDHTAPAGGSFSSGGA